MDFENLAAVLDFAIEKEMEAGILKWEVGMRKSEC